MNICTSQDYFEWLASTASPLVREDIDPYISFRLMLKELHSIPFVMHRYEKDNNRILDGLSLRERYSILFDVDNEEPDIYDASVLEVMVALALKIEEDIMSDPRYGDRTHQWFNTMLSSMGLGSFTDVKIAKHGTDEIHNIINTMMFHKYEKNGTGGLFRIRKTTRDMRSAELWHQACWYLDRFDPDYLQ